jgi:hypothetical protein
VCQRHNRAINVFGFASAFFRIAQVSQAKVFSEKARLVCMIEFQNHHAIGARKRYIS